MENNRKKGDMLLTIWNALGIAVILGFFVFSVRQLYVNANEKSYAYRDSEIMIKALEERVNAVNRWDQ